MSPSPPQLHFPQLSKKYYTIGEVAQLLNVSTSLIRFWEKKFPMLRPKKNAQGIRKYTAADVATLRRIYSLVKEQGYTLSGAKEVLRHPRSDATHSQAQAAAIQALKDLRTFLVDLKEGIEAGTAP